MPQTDLQAEVKLVQRGMRRSGMMARGEAVALIEPSDKPSSAVRSESCMKEEVRVMLGGVELKEGVLIVTRGRPL